MQNLPPQSPVAFRPAGQNSPDALSAVGFALVLLLVGLFFGRLIELIPPALMALRPGIVLMLAAVAVAALSGRITRLAAFPGVTLCMLGFTFWSGLGIAFAVWRGGAFETWTKYWLSSLVLYVVVSTLCVGVAQCRKALYVIAASMLAILALSFSMAGELAGRGGDRLGFDAGTLRNSNELAMILLMGLPFALLAASHWKGFWKAAAVLAAMTLAAFVFRTGSRAGLLGLLLLGLLIFFRAGVAGKAKLLLAAVVVVPLGIALSADSAVGRFGTLFRFDDSAPASAEELSAMSSSQMRRELLRRSIDQTWRHPLMGVGMGVFMAADSNDAAKFGIRALWHVSHNAYTQVSSETGIPGFLLYIAVMLLCWRKMRGIEKITRKVPRFAVLSDMAFALRAALLVYAFESFFASSAYQCYLPILAGLIVTFENSARAEIQAARGEVAAPPSAPPSVLLLPRARRRAALSS